MENTLSIVEVEDVQPYKKKMKQLTEKDMQEQLDARNVFCENTINEVKQKYKEKINEVEFRLKKVIDAKQKVEQKCKELEDANQEMEQKYKDQAKIMSQKKEVRTEIETGVQLEEDDGANRRNNIQNEQTAVQEIDFEECEPVIWDCEHLSGVNDPDVPVRILSLSDDILKELECRNSNK